MFECNSSISQNENYNNQAQNFVLLKVKKEETGLGAQGTSWKAVWSLPAVSCASCLLFAFYLKFDGTIFVNNATNVISMKKIFLAVLCVSCGSILNTIQGQEASNASAVGTNYKTAIGLRLSNTAPIVSNAVTIKHFLNEKTAIEGLISFGHDITSFGVLGEIHKPFSTPGLQWYYGAGAYLGFGKEYDVNKARDVNTTFFGGQGVVGLDYKFASIPINLSLDWKPELNLVSDINFEPSAIGFSARFTFAK